jgi:hypothetical protein
MDVLLPGPNASNPFGTPACVRCARGVLGLEEGAETEGGEVSTGPGKLQRRLIEVVEAAENRTMTRRRLEEIMVAEKYDRSNVLRGLRSLADRRLVYLREGHTLDESYVLVPEPVRMFSDDEIFAMMEEP